MKQARNPIGLLFITILFDMLGYGILIPVLPSIFADPNSPSYLLNAGTSLKTGYLLLGILTALYPLGQFIATPILGQLSDRFGRKPILALSLFGTAVGYFLFAVGIVFRSVPLLFISRFFDGLTGGNISVAQAAIADTTTLADRAKRFGLIGVAFGIGFVVGPFLGGILVNSDLISWFSAKTPFLFAGMLALLNALCVIFFLPETNKNRRIEKIDWKRSVKNIATAYTLPKVSGVFATSFLFTFGFTFFTSFINVFLIQRFAFGEHAIGIFFAYIGIWSILAQGLFVRQLGKRFKPEDIIFWALLGIGLTVLLFFVPSTWQGLLFVVPLFSCMSGCIHAYLPMLVSKYAPDKDQGELLGVNASVQALGSTIPALLSGSIAALIAPSMPLVAGAVVLVFASFVFHRLVRGQTLHV